MAKGSKYVAAAAAAAACTSGELMASDELIGGARALEGHIPRLVSESSACACKLSPCGFFIAWNGVLTLVYSGFPPSLVALKAALSDSADCGLTPENFGSRWPKTTLGALADDAPMLTLSEFEALKALCERHGTSGLQPLEVCELSIVTYVARGLEAVFAPSKATVRLPPAHSSSAFGAPPAEEHAAVVRSVLSEWDEPAAYLPRVNQPGSRIGSYRHTSPAGCTLVCFLASDQPDGAPPDGSPPADGARRDGVSRGPNGGSPRGDHSLLGPIRAFRDDVEALLPGRYVWLAEESFHVTVRALL